MSIVAIHPVRRQLREVFAVPLKIWQRLTLALGRSGTIWATVAAVAAGTSVLVSLGTTLVSLKSTDVRRSQEHEEKIVSFNRTGHRLMRIVTGLSTGFPDRSTGLQTGAESWRTFGATLRDVCSDLDPTIVGIDRLRKACRPDDPFLARMTLEIDAYDPPSHAFPVGLMREMQALRDETIYLTDVTIDRASIVGRSLTEDYERAMMVLTASGVGFAVSTLVLLVLVGRASLRHYAKAEEVAAAARAATDARDLLRETVDSMPAGIVVYDRDERLMMYNAVAAEISPLLTRDEAIGMTYEEIIRSIAASGAADSLIAEKPQSEWVSLFRRRAAPHAHRLPDGRWFEWSDKTTPSGKTVGLRVDVTQIKSQALDLDRARAQYQSLIESLSDTVYALDVKGRFSFASPSVEALLGISAEALIGRRFTDFIPPEEVKRVIDEGRAMYTSVEHDVQARSIRVVRPDGEIRHVDVRYRKPLAMDSASGIVVGVMRDVTEAVMLARRVEEDRTRLRSIFESSGALILLTDADLRIEMANHEFLRQHEIAEQATIGRPITDFFDPKLDRALVAQWRSGPLTPEQAEPVRYTMERPDADGRRRMLNVTAKPIVDADGMMRQIVFLGVDDTDRRDAEQALFDADRLATLGEMAATVGHELRQPLQVITLACGSAMEEVGDDPDREGPPDPAFIAEKLQRIVDQVERANRIIGELRVYARGSVGEAPRPFDPVTPIKAAIDMTSVANRSAQAKIALSLPPDLPRLTGHASRLEQVLINLVNNARDAGARNIEVIAEARTAADRREVHLTVADDGPGIPDHVLPRLFNSFVTTKPRGKGTGLGLRICRRIIEEMGGTIVASNRSEGGARFEVVLPAGA